MQTLKLTPVRVEVLIQALTSIGWDALPNAHPHKKAAHAMLAELARGRMGLPKPAPALLMRLRAAGSTGNGITMRIVAESDAAVLLVNGNTAETRVQCTLVKLPDGTLQGTNGQTWEVLERL